MQCAACETRNPDGARYCLNCGQSLGAPCPDCGSVSPPGSRFCTACGTRLGGRDETREEAVAAQAPERRIVTVLFADIVGSTARISALDPEEAAGVLSPLIDAMCGAVHRFGGFVVRTQGDGIMALFGAPASLENHARMACSAALDMCQGSAARLPDGPPIRVGLHSGEVMVRRGSNDFSAEYEVVGDTVHVASWIEELAEPGSVCISLDTQRLARDFIEVEPRGLRMVKGVGDPVRIFALTRVAQRGSRLDMTKPGQATAFAGRGRELEVLLRCFDEAAGGRCRVVVVSSDAGYGKSRLAREFLNRAQARAARSLRSPSLAFAETVPFGTLRRLVVQLLGLEGLSDPEEMRPLVLEGLRGGARRRFLKEAVFDLLGLPLRSARWARLSLAERRLAITAAFAGLLLDAAKRQPLIVLIEDLQWVDEDSQRALQALVARAKRARLMLILNSRPDLENRGETAFAALPLELAPLSEADSRLLLQSLLGDDPSMTPLIDSILERCEGNPFFMEECCRALVDEGMITGPAGEHRLSGEVEGLAIPASVQAVIAARIDRLDRGLRDLLLSAAVIGKDFQLPLLREVSDWAASDLREAMQALQAAGFVRAIGDREGNRHSFTHALTHEVAYGLLTYGRRRRLHAAVVGVLEGRAGPRSEARIEALAAHAWKGQLWGKAADHARTAGDRAYRRFANKEAVAKYEQALAATEKLSDDEALARRFDLLAKLRFPLFQLGRLDQVLEVLQQAQLLADYVRDPQRQGLTLVLLSHINWLLGDQKLALAMARRARGLGQRKGMIDLEIRARFQRALGLFARCRYGDAVEDLRAVYRHLEAKDYDGGFGLDLPLAAIVLGYTVRALAELGRFEEAERLAEQALALVERFDNRFHAVIAFIGVGYLYHKWGRPKQALRYLEAAHDLCRRSEATLMAPIAASFLGTACVADGAVARGLTLLETACAEGRRMHLRVQQPLRLVFLATALAAAGRREEALTRLTEAERLAAETDEPGSAAAALALRGRLEAQNGSATTRAGAEATLQRALRQARRLHLAPLAAEIEGVLAEAPGPKDGRRGARSGAAEARRAAAP